MSRPRPNMEPYPEWLEPFVIVMLVMLAAAAAAALVLFLLMNTAVPL